MVGHRLRRWASSSIDRFMYYQFRSVYEAIELGMRSAKKKPLTKKERAEKRKRRKEKRAAKWTAPLRSLSASTREVCFLFHRVHVHRWRSGCICYRREVRALLNEGRFSPSRDCEYTWKIGGIGWIRWGCSGSVHWFVEGGYFFLVACSGGVCGF